MARLSSVCTKLRDPTIMALEKKIKEQQYETQLLEREVDLCAREIKYLRDTDSEPENYHEESDL